MVGIVLTYLEMFDPSFAPTKGDPVRQVISLDFE
jgi:hypothetical protein